MEKTNAYTFAELLPERIKQYEKNDALGFAGEKATSYAEMGDKIYAIISFLEKLNIKEGDKVAIFGQNMPNWGIVYFALQFMGVIAVPLLPDFTSNELQNIFRHSNTKAIFVSENLTYKLEDINCSNMEVFIRMENMEILPQSKISAVYEEKARPKKTYATDENALAILLYTSGTTGESKGVMLSQKNVLINAEQAANVQNIKPYHRFLSILPLSHTYENTLGLILPILYGASVSYLKKPPTSPVLLEAMAIVKPHIMLTVPMIIEKVYRNKVLPTIKKKITTRILYGFRPTQILLHKIAGKKLYANFGGNLIFFGIGGAKLNAKVERFLRDAKFPYAIGYGLTETSPLIAGSNANHTKFQAIGPKVKYADLKIHNPNPKTGEGEVWTKGPNIMLGYYKDEQKTKEVLTEDRWFKTGDLGVLDKNQVLTHKGRLKNVIIGANGENIYPEEIEALINNFGHVIESLVIEKKGKLLALVRFNVEALEEKYADLKHDIEEQILELSNDLQHYLNQKLNKISRVQSIIIQKDPFKRTATQKIKRYLYI
ncbi:MAG TPA: long-chain fatty acid--CoA ligase [Bacteroidetes bacterium]|nr:long-chain fatty acid--CoA ligase [Bacteroidota bacterium]